jgi:hypothetical protein
MACRTEKGSRGCVYKVLMNVEIVEVEAEKRSKKCVQEVKKSSSK